MIALLLAAASLQAADWPEWRGAGRTGVFTEDGILEKFPASGLKVRWRVPVGASFAGPAVSGGLVFVPDFQREQGQRGKERLLALEETTGKVHWTREWPANYTGLQGTYATGPRATPTVDGDRVYVLGAMGMLHALNTRTGDILWSRDYVKEFGTHIPTWGMTASPLVAGNKLICLVGGEGNAKVVALDKLTGKEAWRALETTSEPGYSPPILITAGGKKQVIQWHSTAVTSLDPDTGKVLWEHPWRLNLALNPGTPVSNGSLLFVSAFYDGPVMFQLDDAKPTAQVLWKGKSKSEIQTDGLHSIISTPVIDGDYIYGVDSYGQFRCLNAKTGERVWESLDVTGEKARWSTALIVKHKDRYFINNDRGELIIAKLSPKGYEEISRTTLIKPTSNPGNKRERQFVNWSQPAYANGHILARNDEEIIAASLQRSPE